MEQNKNNKLGLGILIGVLVTLVIGLTGFIIYDKVLKDDNVGEQVENDNQDSLNNSNQEENTNEFSNIDVNS